MGSESADSPLAQRAREIFRQAVEREPEERAAFLDRACDDGDLRAEVESLLAYDAENLEWAPGDFPLCGLLDAGAVAEALVGRRIGAWRVLRLLGEGGMGAVYLVERADGVFDQRAALKLIRSELWAPDLGRRLEAERQILAELKHPNIARLLGGGTTDAGQSYLVMELVEGRPIDRYCREEGLSVGARLALFGQVCRAVEHAHRALIVHRDLKPSNIVVDGDGHVTLLDFGIARALAPPVEPPSEPRGDSASGAQLLMTPSYASPEQVRGEAVTTATDVYQLGLLLYELLTGRLAQPASDLSLEALERAICEAPITLPSTLVLTGSESAPPPGRRSPEAVLARRLRGDLDSIVATALAKDPERRYGSAAQLHEDVERHLRGVPIHARPGTVAYRLRRLVGRHRETVALGTLCLALVVWAVVGSERQRLRELREAERVRHFETVIGSLFEYPRETELGREPQLADFVEHAAVLIRRELRDQPAVQVRLLTRLGGTYSAMGAYRRAVATFEEALALAAPSGDPETRSQLLYRRGRNQHFAGLLPAAETSLREAASLRDGIFGPADPRAIAVRLELADLLHSLGRLREAEELLAAATDTLQAAEADRVVLTLRARAQGYLGNVLRDRGIHGRAETAYTTAITLITELRGPRDVLVTTNTMHLAHLLVALGRLEEAESRLEDQLEVLREVHHEGHPLTATALRELGRVAIERGQLELAEARLIEAREITDQWLAPDHPSLPRILALQAELERRAGHNAEAARLARQTLDHFARLGLNGHPAALDACLTLGRSLRALRALPVPSDLAHQASCFDAAERELVAGDPRIADLRELASRVVLKPGQIPTSNPDPSHAASAHLNL